MVFLGACSAVYAKTNAKAVSDIAVTIATGGRFFNDGLECVFEIMPGSQTDK